MKWLHSAMHVSIVLAIALAMVVPASATKEEAPYQTGFTRWRAAEGGFAGWTLSGVSLTPEGLVQDFASSPTGTDPYPAGGYYGINFYNGGSYRVGEATSPVVPASFNFTEAIASWNATTPEGTWIEVLISAKLGERWTKWYNLGVWAIDSSTIERHSVRLQGDGDGFVAVDTLVLTNKKAPASAFQLKLRLFSADGVAVPSVRNVSVAYSTSPVKKVALQAGNPAYWNRVLPVPECSQMIYSDGGNVWCSPTSTSMVLGYWELDTGACEPRIRAAVKGVYDVIYNGHGNWPFNTAYAASKGMEAYVARLTSMAEVEPWVAAGVPVVVSYAFGKGDLTGAPIDSSSGHLAVVVGFDANGNVVVNDPAATSDEDVQRTYLRAEFEQLWLEHSGGTVYLIYPPGTSVPGL